MWDPLIENSELTNDTQIGGVKREGNSLIIRGYKYEDLINHSSFEEVIHLFLFKQLPNEEELLLLKQKISSYRHIPNSILKVVEKVPLGDPYVMLVSALLVLNSHKEQNETKNLTDSALRIISMISPITLYWYHFHKSNGTKRIETYTGPNDTIAENSLKLLTLSSEVDQSKLKLLDKLYIMAADISTGSGSTFAGRVTASTGASLIQSFVSFLCVWSGKRLSGAIHELGYSCKDFKSLDEAEQMVKEKLKKDQTIYGFEDSNSTTAADSRLTSIIQIISLCKPSKDNQDKHEIYMKILQVMESSKKFVPNMDFYSSVLLNLLDVPFEIYQNIFYVSRSVGALSHIIEEMEEPFNDYYSHAHTYSETRNKKFIPLKDRKQYSPKF